MFIENNRLQFYYNYLNEKRFHIQFDADLSGGKHSLTVDFKKTGTNQGDCRLIVDGTPGSTIDISTYPLFAAPGGFSVGRYATSPVVPRHKDKGYFTYTGEIEKAVYNLERPVNDHDLMLELEEEAKNA